ncbi:hydrogenase [Geitlerinema sp. CS-897]|nr:hydrogenase [Geitlerinema sp. CS-897]
MKPDPKALLDRLTALESELAQLGNVTDSTTLGALKTLLQQQQATAARDPKTSAIALLDRFLALDHQDQPGFPPLAQYKQQVRQFRTQVENASETDLPADVNQLLTGKHPVSQLLKAIDEGDNLTDAQWSSLQSVLVKVFGQAVSIAASRGKLYVATNPPQPAATPAATTPKPASPNEDLLMWGDATEKAAQPSAEPSDDEPLIVFGAKSLGIENQPSGTVPLNVLVHIQGLGDRQFGAREFAGTRGQSKAIEGLQLSFASPVAGLNIEYMAHLAGVGDTPWMSAGQYLGTRNENRQLEGFAVRLVGAEASKYSVCYSAHVQNMGDTPVYADGQFCGSRGKSLRVEGLRVWVQPKA